MRTRPAPAQLKLSTTTVDPRAGWDSETPAKPASAVMPSVRQPRVPDDGLNATIMLPEPAHIGTYGRRIIPAMELPEGPTEWSVQLSVPTATKVSKDSVLLDGFLSPLAFAASGTLRHSSCW